MPSSTSYFPRSYAESRERFLSDAARLGADVRSWPIEALSLIHI